MSRVFELTCIVLLGLGQMCIMTGYDTQSFVQESVIHSIHEREPRRIDAYAGYYGQAVCYAAYMISCLFAPYIMTVLGAKWTLFIGSVCYTAYQIGFFFLNSYYYYFSCAVMGAGFALYYTGNGGYLTSHSTRKTIQQNSAISWAIACVCMLVGSGILAFIFSLDQSMPIAAEFVGNATEIHHYRKYSSNEILLMYGAFTAVTIAANLIFFIIPTKEIPNCIEGKESAKKSSFLAQMDLIYSIFLDKRMILLSIHFLHLGLYTSFWVSVYPTTLSFTKSLGSYVYLPAIYSCAVGAGEIAMCTFISKMSDRYNDFGLKPTILMGFFLTTLALFLIGASTPAWSTILPNAEPALLFQPSLTGLFGLTGSVKRFVGSDFSLQDGNEGGENEQPDRSVMINMRECPFISILASCTIIAFVIGLADSTINTARAVICALGFPDKRAQAFSISKFYQAFGGAVLMFASPQLSVYHYCVLLFLSVSLTTVCFHVVAEQTRKMERQHVKFSLESEKGFEQ